MEPHGFFPAELSYLAQGIEAPGRSCAGAAYDGHHLLPLLYCLPVQAVECRNVEPEAMVRGNRDNGLLAQPEDSRRAGHRVVCLVGNQQSQRRSCAESLAPRRALRGVVARCQQRRQIPERSAGGQDAIGIVGPTDRCAKPAYNLSLDLRSSLRHFVDGGAIVQQTRDQVGQRGHGQDGGKLMAHVTRMVQVNALSDDLRQAARDLSLRVIGGVQRKWALVLLGKFNGSRERKNRHLPRSSGFKIGCQSLDDLVAMAPERLGVVRIGMHRP